MQKIQTASWLEIHTISRQEELDDEDALPTRYWLRTDPPALAWRTEYENGWSLRVKEADRDLHTASSWKKCSLYSNRTVLTVEEF